MTQAQSAIVPDGGPYALYVMLKVTDDAALVLQQCQRLAEIAKQTQEVFGDAQMGVAVGFSPAFCRAHGLAYPEGVTDFRPRESRKHRAPHTDCDVFIHLHGLRHDLNFYVFQQWLTPIKKVVDVVDETAGFRYLDARDMTGFIDGTENPQGLAREAVAVIPDGPFAGGSVALVQRYVHDLPAWERLQQAAQEKVIGRTKPDSIELEDMPDTSHVGRVDIKENGVGLKILRQSLPYGSVSGEHGLLFLAYCQQQHPLDVMLDSMFGERDGKTDMMLSFTQAVTGAIMFMPSQTTLSQYVERLSQPGVA